MPQRTVSGSQCFGGQNLSYIGTPQATKVRHYPPPFSSHLVSTLLCFEKAWISGVVLGAVGCENRFNFGCKSIVIHSQVPGALQCPNRPGEWITMLWGPKLKLFWHTTRPQKCSTTRPLFLLIWYPYCCVLKGADSRAVLGAVGCENRFNFGSKSIVIHSQVPGQCNAPTDCEWITMLWGPKLKLFWHSRGPKSARLPAPFFFSCGPHSVVF